MTSHLGYLALFAACLSAVFAVVQRERTRDQLRLGLRMFAALVLSAWALGWVMLGLFG
jgi:hypothetical protein